MGKAMQTVFLIVGLVITIMMFPMALSAMHDIQTDSQTEVEAAVTTGVGVTTANVVLTYDIFNENLANVTSITSDELTDVPVAGTWVAATNTLTVTGLAADDSRTLTITYNYDGLTDYTGLGTVVGISPILLWLVIMGALGFGLYSNVKT